MISNLSFPGFTFYPTEKNMLLTFCRFFLSVISIIVINAWRCQGQDSHRRSQNQHHHNHNHKPLAPSAANRHNVARVTTTTSDQMAMHQHAQTPRTSHQLQPTPFCCGGIPETPNQGERGRLSEAAARRTRP
jgi:hypothetical protein